MTRTQNSFFNFVTGIGSSMLVIILSFITRTIFINQLGDSYLGIEGLFSNILSMLSLVELGFGSAITFKLYKPIEENDRPRILVLLKLYRRTYYIIGCIIAVIGVCLIPFLPKLVEDYHLFAELGLNPILIFLLYLFRSVSSYWFFAYKQVFVQANQKAYILNVIGYGVSFTTSIFQIIALVVFKNFMMYLLVQIFFSILANLLYAWVCDKRYPYVREKTSDRVSKEELKGFMKDCSALLLYRAGNIVLNSSDTIVVSSILGLRAVGLYSIYTTVKLYLGNMLYTFTSSIQSSLGSIYSTGKLEWSRLSFRLVNFCTAFLYGIVAIGIAVLMDDFITLWVGPDFVVTSWEAAGRTIRTPIALLVGIEFYSCGQTYYCGSMRHAMGLFQELKFRPIISIIVNLVVCLLTVPHIGIAGCMVSTIIANYTTNLLIDPIIFHKYGLKAPVRPYFIRNIVYKIVVAGAGILAWFVCSLIPLTGIIGFIAKGFVCVIIPASVFCICFCRTEEFHYMRGTVKELLGKFFSRKPAKS